MNKNLGKISFLGNCQTLAYSKYFSMLLPDNEVRWLCPDIFANNGSKWMKMTHVWGDTIDDHIMCQDEVHDHLLKSDILIHMPINPKLSKNHNSESINKKYKKNTKIATISTIHKSVEGMKEREKEKKLDIRLSKIFDLYPDLAGVIEDDNNMHPNTFTILEAMRMICDFLCVPYFEYEDYTIHLNSGHPFEQKG